MQAGEARMLLLKKEKKYTTGNQNYTASCISMNTRDYPVLYNNLDKYTYSL